MPHAVIRLLALGALALAVADAPLAFAQGESKQKTAAVAAPEVGSPSGGVDRYCAHVASAAVEARIAWQARRLTELEAQIKERIAELDSKAAEARDWVAKREAMLNSANQELVAIYAKMDPEAAATQLATMEDDTAVSILSKLNARAASAILNEMDAAKASKLTSMLSGAGAEKKS